MRLEYQYQIKLFGFYVTSELLFFYYVISLFNWDLILFSVNISIIILLCHYFTLIKNG